MPEPIHESIKEKAKMVAMQIGVKEAARELGIPEGTVKAWSAREGWMQEKAKYEALKEEKRLSQPGATRSPSEVLLRYGDRTKLRLAKTTDKTALKLSKQSDEELVRNTQALVNTVTAASKLHNWQPSNTQPLVNINLANVKLPDAP